MIKHLGLQPYEKIYRAMQQFTRNRDASTPDEIWLLEHEPVLTKGRSSRPEDLLQLDPNIPLIETDRGGQITYHGPGQLIGYLMIDLHRRSMNLRDLLDLIHDAILQLLSSYSLHGELIAGQPGIYLNGAKIAFVGLRIQRGCSYHGFSLNVNGDFTPFSSIIPCGIRGLTVTRLADFACIDSVEVVAMKMDGILTSHFPTAIIH